MPTCPPIKCSEKGVSFSATLDKLQACLKTVQEATGAFWIDSSVIVIDWWMYKNYNIWINLPYVWLMCSLRRLYLRHQHTTRQSLTVQVTGRQPLADLVYVRGGFHKAYLRSHNRLPTSNPFMACCHTCAQRNGMIMDECKTYELYWIII